jgi:hypothetical protein
MSDVLDGGTPCSPNTGPGIWWQLRNGVGGGRGGHPTGPIHRQDRKHGTESVPDLLWAKGIQLADVNEPGRTIQGLWGWLW